MTEYIHSKKQSGNMHSNWMIYYLRRGNSIEAYDIRKNPLLVGEIHFQILRHTLKHEQNDYEKIFL